MSKAIVLISKFTVFIFCCILLAACGEETSDSDNSGKPGNGTATLSWLPPTQTADGAPLTTLAGYKIYYGTSFDELPNVITINSPGISTYMIEGLPEGNTYYFAITAIDTAGMESEFSDIASKDIPA